MIDVHFRIDNRNVFSRYYVDLMGEGGSTVEYRLELSFTVSTSSSAGGKLSKKSDTTIKEYTIRVPATPSRVEVLTAYESGGVPAREDLGIGSEGSVFEYKGVRSALMEDGQIITGWKMRVAGEAEDRDIDVEWNQDEKRIKFTLPAGLDGKDVLLIPQVATKSYSVTYQAAPTDAEIDLPENQTLQHGSILTIKPIGEKSGIHSVGFYVYNEAVWGGATTVEVTGDIVVNYVLVGSETITVTYDDPAGILKGEETYERGDSFWDKKEGGTAYGLYELTGLQVGVPDENGDMTFSDDLTISAKDPITEDMTLRPIWHRTVTVMIDTNYCTVTAPRTGGSYGYFTDGDTAEISYEPSVTTKQVPCGWKIYRFETPASNPFGTTYSLNEDEIRTTDATTIMNGLSVCEADAEGIRFTIAEDMAKPTTESRRVYISVYPILTTPVTDSSTGRIQLR